jgi:hypothetical protein
MLAGPLASRQAAVEAFLAANEQRRHHFVQELVDRWALAPEMSASTLAALLAASSQSPARLSLIHSTLASTLAASLLQAGHQAAQHNAAVTAAHVLSQHGRLLPALVAALEAQPAELNSAGLVTLAQLSEAARTRLFPELLERRLASVFALPRATVAAGPEAVAEYTAHLQRLLGDVDVVKTLCATSPYKPAFERAFSSAAAA